MAYAYRGTITIDHTKCGASDSSNFTFLWTITDSRLKTVANGGAIQNTVSVGGLTVPADLIFTSDAAGVNVLAWEWESYDPTTGFCLVWIYLGAQSVSLSHSSNTVVYALFGNSSVTTFQGGSAGAAWHSSYQAIYHGGDGTTISVADSKGTFGNGTNNGASAAAGKINGAMSFNGTSNYVDLGNTTTHLNTARTLQAWIKPGSTAAGQRGIIEKGYRNSDNTVETRVEQNGNQIGSYAFNGSNQGISTSVGTVVANTWYLIHSTWDGTIWKLYINGALDSQATNSITTSNDRPWAIGADETDVFGNVEFYNGSIDEVRLANVARSADYITAQYNNQNSPSTFSSWAVTGLSTINAATASFAGAVTKTTGHVISAASAAWAATLVAAHIFSLILSAATASFSGAVTKTANKLLTAATSSFSAGLVRSTLKLLSAGTASFSGSLQRITDKTLTAATAAWSATLTGIAVHVMQFVAAMSSFSGSLIKKTEKVIEGATASFSGTVLKRAGKVLTAATANFAGSTSRVTSKILVASQSAFAALVSKETNKTVSAATASFAGLVSRKIDKVLTGAMSTWSALVSTGNSYLQELDAAMAAFSGAISKSAYKLVVATMSNFSGVISKQIYKTIAASMSSFAALVIGATGKLSAALFTSIAVIQNAVFGSVQNKPNATTSSVTTTINATMNSITTEPNATADSFVDEA